jgi:hypothetical protein
MNIRHEEYLKCITEEFGIKSFSSVYAINIEPPLSFNVKKNMLYIASYYILAYNIKADVLHIFFDYDKSRFKHSCYNNIFSKQNDNFNNRLHDSSTDVGTDLKSILNNNSNRLMSEYYYQVGESFTHVTLPLINDSQWRFETLNYHPF